MYINVVVELVAVINPDVVAVVLLFLTINVLPVNPVGAVNIKEPAPAVPVSSKIAVVSAIVIEPTVSAPVSNVPPYTQLLVPFPQYAPFLPGTNDAILPFPITA